MLLSWSLKCRVIFTSVDLKFRTRLFIIVFVWQNATSFETFRNFKSASVLFVPMRFLHPAAFENLIGIYYSRFHFDGSKLNKGGMAGNVLSRSVFCRKCPFHCPFRKDF